MLDREKPLWAEVASGTASRIRHPEMARINIEASAALAEWIDLHRAEAGGRRYQQLIGRAVAYLPMPAAAAKPSPQLFEFLARPDTAAGMVEAASADWLKRARADAERHPTRVFANALLNVAWRNGPVEDIHAGDDRGCPLDQRRMSPAEEHQLMAFATERLARGDEPVPAVRGGAAPPYLA